MIKEMVSWDEITDFVEKLCEHYKDRKFPGVFGIPRGGLVFAVMISHRLEIPMLVAPCKDCLIVDDISDTGKTLVHYAEGEYEIATMFYKQGSLVKPDYYAFEKFDKWIVYPWEV